MPIIHWPVNDLKELDRMQRKILNDTKAKHPASSNELLYFPSSKGGRGLKSVEQVYSSDWSTGGKAHNQINAKGCPCPQCADQNAVIVNTH